MSPAVSTPQFSGRPARDIRLNDFSGGYISTPGVISAGQIPERYAQVSQNIDTSGRSIRKQRGFVKYTQTPVSGDISTIYWDGFLNTTLVTYGTNVGQISGTSIAALTGGTGFTNNLPWSMCRVNTNLLMVNGTDTPQIYNGTTMAAVATPPATWITGNYPKICIEWMGRAFAAGGANDPDILYYSKLFDVTFWTPGINAGDAGAIQIGRDGRPITALWPLSNGLLIFKDRGLYYMSGGVTYLTALTQGQFDQTKFSWAVIASEVDCVGQRAVVAVEDVIYAWGRKAVYQINQTTYQGQVGVVSISKYIISDVMQVINNLNLIGAAHYPQRNQIWFGVSKNSGSAQIDTIYCYDYFNRDDNGMGGWSVRTGYNHKCMANVRDTTGVYQIYSGGYNGNGYVFQQNVGVDFDGVAMNCQYNSFWVPLQDVAKGKTNRVFLELGPQTNAAIQYNYAYDFSNSYYDSRSVTPTLGSSLWNSTGTLSIYTTNSALGTWTGGVSVVQKIPIFGRGRRMQHRFYSNAVGADFDILEILQPVTSVGYV